MKNFATNLMLTGIVVYLSIGNAAAEFCGAEGLPACQVPEPSTASLLLAAVGVAAVVAKIRKKK